MKSFIRFIIFCFVGATSALVHLIVFNIFFYLFKSVLNIKYLLFGASLSYYLSTLMGIIISIIYNFSMNRNFTFSAKQESIKKQMPRFAAVYSLSISVNFIVSLIILNIIGESTINANIATFFGIVSSIPVSYFGSLLWTFRKR